MNCTKIRCARLTDPAIRPCAGSGRMTPSSTPQLTVATVVPHVFALGFLLCGLKSALTSGALEATI